MPANDPPGGADAPQPAAPQPAASLPGAPRAPDAGLTDANPLEARVARLIRRLTRRIEARIVRVGASPARPTRPGPAADPDAARRAPR